jgi:hypothetical protein
LPLAAAEENECWQAKTIDTQYKPSITTVDTVIINVY